MDASSSLFTCISCAVAFSEPALQRAHFASDWHRYNMKRRVATLPPVSAASFNAKVLERREQTAVRPDPKGMTCEACKKVFSTENAYRSHMASKKHQEREVRRAAGQIQEAVERAQRDKEEVQARSAKEAASTPAPAPAPAPAPRLVVDADADDDEVGLSIDAKIAAARNRLSLAHCLFCTHVAPSGAIEDNLAHMSSAHSFFIPDREYLVDLPGLLTYLGEKIAVGNTCLACPNGGREFSSTEAVRAHMRDKAHCRIAYDTDDEKLEVSDYYDFESSYPDVEARKVRRAERRARKAEEKRMREEEEEAKEEDEWEAVSDEDAETDEEVYVEGSEEDSDSDDESDLSDPNGITLAADGLSLRLPSGRTLGHRSLKIYYNQNLRPVSLEPLTNSSTALTTKLRTVRKQLNDPTQAVVSTKGGSGGYGQGLQVMKARNAGEARWAKNKARQNLEWRAAEAHRTRVGFTHNSQKHFRDPLLQ